MAVVQARPNRAGALALRVWPVLPALSLIWPAMKGSPMLVVYAGNVLGLDALLALVACLAVTPVLNAVRLHISVLRQWYGIWVFILGAAGLALTVSAPPGSLAYRAAGNAVNWTGLVIVMLLLPMTATSSAAAQKLLGPEWKRWMRYLIWAVWFLIFTHLVFLHATIAAAALGGATVPLIILRHSRMRRAVRKWRGDRYTTGGMWAVLTICCLIVTAGVTVLLARMGLAAYASVTLAP